MAAAALGVLLAESARGREGHEVDGFRGSGASRGHFARREVRRLSLRPRWLVGRLGEPGRDRRRPQPHQGRRSGAAEPCDSHRWLSRRTARSSPSGVACRCGGSVDAGWAVPTMGGPLQPYLQRHLRARLVARRDDASSTTRQRRAIPCSSPRPTRRSGVRSMLRGPASITTFPSGRMTARSSTSSTACRSMKATSGAFDPTGGEPERLTFHDSRVTFPTLLDNRTLLYLATDADGSGPWIYAIDVERRVTPPHQHGRRTSTRRWRPVRMADVSWRPFRGRRNSSGRVPIADRVVDESRATPISLPTASGLSPRIGPRVHHLPCPEDGKRCASGRSRTAEQRQSCGMASTDAPSRGPAIAPDGQRLAFVVQTAGTDATVRDERRRNRRAPHRRRSRRARSAGMVAGWSMAGGRGQSEWRAATCSRSLSMAGRRCCS